MRVTWAHKAGAVVAFGFAVLLSACGGDSSLRVQVAAPPAPNTAPSVEAKSPAAQLPLAAPSAPGPLAAAQASGVSGLPKGRVVSGSTRLVIPSIGVEAPMVTLGVDPDGRMQVPNNGTDVGWYNFSAAPGLSGNAVLSGHVDTATSHTAVFTRLHELKLSDAISIVENGQKADFNVFWMRSWPDDTAPLNLILGNAPSPTLTLITCSGTFDRVTRNYTERLVVRAKLPGSV